MSARFRVKVSLSDKPSEGLDPKGVITYAINRMMKVIQEIADEAKERGFSVESSEYAIRVPSEFYWDVYWFGMDEDNFMRRCIDMANDIYKAMKERGLEGNTYVYDPSEDEGEECAIGVGVLDGNKAIHAYLAIRDRDDPQGNGTIVELYRKITAIHPLEELNKNTLINVAEHLASIDESGIYDIVIKNNKVYITPTE